MLFSYVIKRLKRQPSQAFLSTAVVAIVVILLLGLQFFYVRQEQRLENVYDEIPIRCTVTNVTGSRKMGLSIDPSYLALFEEEKGALAPYTKDIFMIRKMDSALAYGNVLESEWVDLYMTNSPRDYSYLANVNITFLGEDGLEVFHGEEPVCLISSTLSKFIEEDGKISVVSNAMTTRLRVVGTFEDDGMLVFVNWAHFAKLLRERSLQPIANGMSFVIADNRKLDEVKSLLLEYFVPASRTNKTEEGFGLVVDDGKFIDAVVVLERSLALLRIVRVLVYVLSIGISFLVSFLSIRTRKLELAVMRSLGTHASSIYIEVLFEHTLFFLVGAGVASLAAMPFGLMSSTRDLRLVGVFMLCYLFGVALAVWQATSGPIMQTLKGKE